MSELQPPAGGWRYRVYVIIFGHDTKAGKLFDVALMWAILASVVVLMLESVVSIATDYRTHLRVIEWILTGLFSAEYIVRLLCVRRPAQYARSFFGVVDLLAVLPTYLSVLLPGTQSLATLRALRLLRAFRVLKLIKFAAEGEVLLGAVTRSMRKIIVFVGAVLTMVLVVGSAMYWVEGAAHGFTSIPRSMYWAIVTMTTVGYGDISPQTVPGQFLAAVVMILGYGVIAVPTGIVSAEFVGGAKPTAGVIVCSRCNAETHQSDATYCRVCGERLAHSKVF